MYPGLFLLVALSASVSAQPMGIFQKIVDYYNQDPNTVMERVLFSNMKPDISIDFVIDLNYSPANDGTDKRVVFNPLVDLLFADDYDANGSYPPLIDVSSIYYESVALFINAVTLDIRPSQVYTTLIDNGQKYYIRGRLVNQTTPLNDVVTLADQMTRSRALWPHMTGYDEAVLMNGLFKNNLGRMTKLALQARDNGLPIVLKDRKELATGFTIVITDGSAKTPAYLYSNDPSKTMIIDVGGRRYVQKLAFSDIIQYANVIALDAPQVLPLLANTARYAACSAVSM